MSDAKTGPDAIWAPWRLPYLESIDDNAGPDQHARPPGAADPSVRAEGETPASAPTPENQPQSPPPADLRPQKASFLVDYWAAPERDPQNLVIWRDDAGMILLNRYPYANGHLLVALGEPRPRLLDYEPEQRLRLFALIERAMGLMERALEPQGVNVGINQGKAAGAGVPQHLHAHLVPRWSGDTNFMSAVGGIRVIPSALEAMWTRYRKVIDAAA